MQRRKGKKAKMDGKWMEYSTEEGLANEEAQERGV